MRPSFRPSFSKGFSKPKKKFEHNKELYGDNWSDISTYVKKRDDYRCMAYKIGGPKCNGRFPPPFSGLLHAHHIVSLSKGGANHPRNLICVCHTCHSAIHGRKIGSNITQKQRTAASRV